MSETKHKLGLFALIAMCIGSMIGAGLFALPQNVACKAGVIAILIAWIITFFGMLSLSKVFRSLATRCPDLDAGIYAYAKAGFGNYVGFSSAWGYWISVWVGNVGYIIMLCAAMSLFFPAFSDGTSLPSLILSSTIIWSVTYLCVHGIRSAALVNIITTAVKILPVIIFIVIAAYAFKWHIFTANIHNPWQDVQLGSTANQIKNMMLITVWVFIGIEGASVFSARAKNRQDIGRATIISFLVMFFILFAISILPFGILSQAELATLQHPSTGSVLAYVTGVWGNALMNIGLIISVLGAFLSWVLIAAEVPFVAGKKDGLFPKVFALENKNHFPVGALIITALCEQIYLIIAHLYHAGYLVTILFATAMILPPYLFAAAYSLMLSFTGKTYKNIDHKIRTKELIISFIAVLYGIWLLYAAGKYLLLSSILYLIGSIIFIIHSKLKRQKVFEKHEMILFLIIGILSIISVIIFVTQGITLE